MFPEITIMKEEAILTALKQMDLIRRKLLLVVDHEKYFGLLSIGDIQRAIINNTDLKSAISRIMRNDHIVAHPEETIEDIKCKMLEIRSEFMPVIDDYNNLVSVIFWEEVFGEKKRSPIGHFDLPVVIMAGGEGRRLKPLTNVLPKPLIPIGEKTMLEEIIERFANFGCSTFYISLNYKADLIKYYMTTKKLPYQIEFFEESKPMGTAGSLSLLKGRINETFFVTNCDILIDQDYSEILEYHYEEKNEITIVAALKHFPISYGIIQTGTNGHFLSLLEKPELTFKINSGMYILEPHILGEIPDIQFLHITQLIDKINKRKGKVGVFPVSSSSWRDIGNWADYTKHIGI